MIELKNFLELAGAVTEVYHNTKLSSINDHALRLSVMTKPYPWHYHPNTDETFIGVEGVVIIETRNAVFELGPGMMVTIPANMEHCTRPKGERSVNLTVEREDIKTVYVE